MLGSISHLDWSAFVFRRSRRSTSCWRTGTDALGRGDILQGISNTRKWRQLGRRASGDRGCGRFERLPLERLGRDNRILGVHRRTLAKAFLASKGNAVYGLREY